MPLLLLFLVSFCVFLFSFFVSLLLCFWFWEGEECVISVIIRFLFPFRSLRIFFLTPYVRTKSQTSPSSYLPLISSSSFSYSVFPSHFLLLFPLLRLSLSIPSPFPIKLLPPISPPSPSSTPSFPLLLSSSLSSFVSPSHSFLLLLLLHVSLSFLPLSIPSFPLISSSSLDFIFSSHFFLLLLLLRLFH